MEVAVDSVGRLMVPKVFRDALGITPGSKVDVSAYGAGLQIIPGRRAAGLVRENGRLVIDSDTPVTDDQMFALIDAGRR